MSMMTTTTSPSSSSLPIIRSSDTVSHPLSLLAATAGTVLLSTAAALAGRRCYRRYASKWNQPKDVMAGGTVAELSVVQNMLVQAHDKGNDQIVCAVVLDGKIPTARDIQATVKLLQETRDATLAAGIVLEEDGQFRLRETVESVRSSGALTVVENEPWQRVYHRYLNTIQFPKPTVEDPMTPTWRLVLVEPTATTEDYTSPVLLFVLHHAAFDGTSRNRLLLEFFKAYAQVVDTKKNTTPIPSSTTRAPIFQGKTLSSHVIHKSWPAFILQDVCYNMLYKEFCWRRTHFAPSLLDSPGMLHPQQHKPETRQVVHQLDEHETAAIIRKAKAEGTTVHGAISAASVFALVATYQDKGYQVPPRGATVRTGHLISLWRQLADYVPANAIAGILISIKTVHVSGIRDSTNPWQVARSIKAGLQGFLPLRFKQMMLNYSLSKLFRAWFHLKRGAVSLLPPEYANLRRASPSISISNNGLQKYQEDYAGTRVEAVYACSARHNSPGDLGSLNLQTVRGRFCIGFAYYTQVWDDATAQTYMAHVQRILQDMCHME